MLMEVTVDTSHGHTAPIKSIAQCIYHERAFVSVLELVLHTTDILTELRLHTSDMSSLPLDLHNRITPD